MWKRFQLPETWKGIGPIDDVGDIRIDGDRLVSFTWKTHIGPSRYRGRSSLMENAPGKRVVMRLDSSEMNGTLSVDLTAAGASTLMDVRLDYITKGTMSSLFFPIISEAIEKGLRSQVDDFAATWTSPD